MIELFMFDRMLRSLSSNIADFSLRIEILRDNWARLIKAILLYNM